MRAATWTDDNRLTLSDLPAPERGPAETLVRVEACGICGSDLHLYRGELKPFPGSAPGHEIAGTVVESSTFEPGTLVAIEPTLGCGGCGQCRGGAPHRCDSLRLMGMTAPGGLQELVAAPDTHIYPVPGGVDATVASLAEPLAVAVRGINMAELKLGSCVLVLGAGTIGLLSVLLAKRVAAEVAITARYPHQAEIARAFGATQVLEPGSKDLRAWAKEARPDVVIETVGGHADTLAEAVYNVRPGGIVVVLGVFSSRPQIPAFRLVNEEVQLRGAVMYGRSGEGSEFGAAVTLLPELQDQLRAILSTPFPLEQANDAFQTALDKTSGSLKVTVSP